MAAVHGSPRYAYFAFCAGGIYACYLTYGVVQEAIYRPDPSDGTTFKWTTTLLTLQCFGHSLFAFAMLFVERQWAARGGSTSGVGADGREIHASHPVVAPNYFSLGGQARTALTAVTFMFAMLSSNEALKYVSYPLQALAKSCKLIPVLIGSVIIGKKKYTMYKYMAVVLMTFGILLYSLDEGGKGKKHGTTDDANLPIVDPTYGYFLLALSLTLDGVTGPTQERVFHEFAPSNTLFMAMTNLYATLVIGTISLASGELQASLAYLTAKHRPVLFDIALFCLTSAAGQKFVFMTMHAFSSLAMTTVTTTRKFFTIVLSVVYFRHTLSAWRWMAVGVVFLGVGMDAYESVRVKNKAHRG